MTGLVLLTIAQVLVVLLFGAGCFTLGVRTEQNYQASFALRARQTIAHLEAPTACELSADGWYAAGDSR